MNRLVIIGLRISL